MSNRRRHSLLPSRLAGAGLLAALLLGGACSLRSTADLRRGHLPDAGEDLRSAADLALDLPVAPPPDGAMAPPPDGGEAPAPDDAGPTPADSAPPSDASPESPPGGGDADRPMARVVLVVGNLVLSPSDTAIQKRLGDLRLAVTLVPDLDVATLNTSGVALVFVSPSVLSTRIGGVFRSLAIPLIVSEPLVFDETGMVDPALMASRGTASRETILEILTPGSPTAAGLSGMVTITTAPVTISWGLPGPRSQRLATVAARPDRIAIFTYEAGAPMVGLTAPARRLGFFLSVNTAASLSPQGWALFDAAVTWTLGNTK
jgi:hypothetical protein